MKRNEPKKNQGKTKLLAHLLTHAFAKPTHFETFGFIKKKIQYFFILWGKIKG